MFTVFCMHQLADFRKMANVFMNATAETSRLLFRSNTAQRVRLIYSNTVDLLNMVRYAIFENGLTRIAVL